ncbi:MAG: Uncharacterised protein [Cellulomonadaceae bacterium TMED98]|nr:MAG: Uncharacterised protein [Cellulomonadaceae bacterium TMED98]
MSVPAAHLVPVRPGNLGLHRHHLRRKIWRNPVTQQVSDAAEVPHKGVADLGKVIEPVVRLVR